MIPVTLLLRHNELTRKKYTYENKSQVINQDLSRQ